MFSRENNASKLVFAYFAQFLFASGIVMIDCQMHSDHMAQFGASEIDRPEFESLLHNAVDQPLVINYPTFLTDNTEMRHE